MCDADFNEEFRDDIEIEDTIDALLEALKEQAEEADGQVRINNPVKVQQVLRVLRIMKHLMSSRNGTDVTYRWTEVTCGLNEPFRETGSVNVSGSNIVFENAELFREAIGLADNFEVYPKTNGTVEMNFTFHGLTIPSQTEDI